jgi:membrane protease YdiL (CAAX protease family)
MLFLVKRTWRTAFLALLVLTGLGLTGRLFFPDAPDLGFSAQNAGLGVAVAGCVLISDLLLHFTFRQLFGHTYLKRHAELAATFRGQSNAAILAGSLMAGIGEELVFRGWSTDTAFLAGSALAFGAFHHIRQRLWPFTVWSAYEGALFATALVLTGALYVTMTAHFVHDLVGFVMFRWLNARVIRGQVAAGTDPA